MLPRPLFRQIFRIVHTPFVYRIQSALHLSSFISFWVSRVAHIVVGMGWDGMRCIFSFECKIQSIKVENFNSIWFNRIKWHQFTLLFTVCVSVLWHGEWITESRARDHLGCLTHNRHMLSICVCCVSMSVTGGRRQTNPTADSKTERVANEWISVSRIVRSTLSTVWCFNANTLDTNKHPVFFLFKS